MATVYEACRFALTSLTGRSERDTASQGVLLERVLWANYFRKMNIFELGSSCILGT